MNGASLSNIVQKFIPKSINSQISIGSTSPATTNYAVQYSGIKLNERIKILEEENKILKNRLKIEEPVMSFIDNYEYKMFNENYYRLMKNNENKTKQNINDFFKVKNKGKDCSGLIIITNIIQMNFIIFCIIIFNGFKIQ